MPLSLKGSIVFLSAIAGIALASAVSIPPVWFFFLFLLGTLVSALAFRNPGRLFLGLIAFFFLLGLFRTEWVKRHDAGLAGLPRMTAEFSGTVAEASRSGNLQRLTLDTPDLGGVRVQATIPSFPEYHRGDELHLSGALESREALPPRLSELLQRNGIEFVMSYPRVIPAEKDGFSFVRFLDGMRRAFEESLKRLLPEPDASYILGILLGERSGLSTPLKEAFARTGTSHIIALSGFNITIIAVSIGWLLGFFHFSPRLRLSISILAVLLFVVMVGGGASVVRAAIMGALALLARERGRIYDMTNALILAALIMLIINPYLLRFDLSFQLSFLATLGIILAPPFFERRVSWLPKPIRAIVVPTLSAELFVIPLILWKFGLVSVIGPVANLLILPLVPSAMLLGFLAGLLGLLGNLGLVFAWPLHLILAYQLGMIRFLSALPGSAFQLPAAASLILAIPALWIVVRYLKARFVFQPRWRSQSA